MTRPSRCGRELENAESDSQSRTGQVIEGFLQLLEQLE